MRQDLRTLELSSANELVCFGGVYSNYLALEAALCQMPALPSVPRLCLGDLGAFGPHPDRVFPLLKDHGVVTIQGNYDDSIGNEKSDCQCGYTDPRDNYFAQLSYDYTLAKTSPANRASLRSLPAFARIQLGDLQVLACHGSPRRTNEFLWESTCSDAFLRHLLSRFECDVLLCTHTGLKWHRELGQQQHVVNVGALGRPENNGSPSVWYATLSAVGKELAVDFHTVDYDFERLAHEMRLESLPEEFVETILGGWWTTCLEILPFRERAQGVY